MGGRRRQKAKNRVDKAVPGDFKKAALCGTFTVLHPDLLVLQGETQAPAVFSHHLHCVLLEEAGEGSPCALTTRLSSRQVYFWVAHWICGCTMAAINPRTATAYIITSQVQATLKDTTVWLLCIFVNLGHKGFFSQHRITLWARVLMRTTQLPISLGHI